MGGIRLRTKFLLSMVVVSAALTFTTLLVVRHTVQQEVRLGIQRDLENSVSAFHNFQQQREVTLERSAALLADLPNVRALMTTHDAATIQDASRDLWQLAGSDLLLLADSSGKVMALQATSREITVGQGQDLFPRVVSNLVSSAETQHWWYVEGHLYEVFLQDIYFGPASGRQVLGYLLLGYEIDDRVARDLSRVAASEVAFRYGDSIVRSTLKPAQESELLRVAPRTAAGGPPQGDLIRLGEERFLASAVELPAPGAPALNLWVLKSFDRATAFLSSLNELLLALGLTAVLAGSLLVFLISHTFTRPLENLVAGVRALEQGDYAYPLQARGGDEVAEVTGTFDRMRKNLQKTHRELLDAERLATIGRMASSISHDLRHSLAAVMANAEFLCESNLTPGQREDLYAEIRVAVNQMTDLIESLLEFSRTRESLRPSYGDVRSAVDRAVQGVKAHPEFQRIRIRISGEGSTEGWFDFKKLERVFLNLLLNACEVVPPESGKIDIALKRVGESLEIRIEDNGPGIAEAVRDRLFEPFVSHGKENGTGMGLTVVQKILQDHGGDVAVEQTSASGTTFRVNIPLNPSAENVMAARHASQ
ncbi:Periplasmic sensor signal transduction histidine kinase [Candidatus Sulfotelmatobacter sp. SbA7]|nr:Periplasmic sensor signal transduction histidine kinase [Candidatus Sulfotelmatobacter sp. SbA7]